MSRTQCPDRTRNGTHSLLAYAGLQAGHTFVHEAIAEPHLHELAHSLMLDEAAPTIEAPGGMDLTGYTQALHNRFATPALRHQLAQIAMDGSQKIPQRWLATLAERQRLGLPSPTLNTCIDLWLRFLASGAMIDDPLVGPLWKALETGRSDGGRKAVFGPGGPLASQWDLCKP